MLLAVAVAERLATHDVVLRDDSLVLRPMTEDDWDVIAPWNTDPRVLWFTDNGAVSQRSLAEVQAIYRGVSQAAEVFVFQLDGVAVGDGWVQAMNLDRIARALPSRQISRVDLQLAHDVWGRGLGTRALRLLTARGFDRGDDLVFGCDIADFNERSRRTFLGCGYVPWRRVASAPGSPTRFVYDMVCRAEWFNGTAPFKDHPRDRIMAGDAPYGATIVVYRHVPELELLLLHRAVRGAEYEGDWAWTPPAGARFPAEPIDECAARELHEETGIDAWPTAVEPEDDGWLVYALEVAVNADVRLDDEHDRYEWVTPANALTRCRPAVVASGISAAIRSIEQTEP